MDIKQLNEMLILALNEETLGYFGMPLFDLPTGVINAFCRGSIDIEKIYYRDDVRAWFDELDDEKLNDIFFSVFTDYTPEDEKQLSRREKELKLLEQNLHFAYEDSERNPDYKEEDYTDRVDANFDISLFEYGIVRNPKDNSVIFGESPNGDTGLYEDYSFGTISYEDVKDAIEEMEDGFFEFIDTPKEELLKEITPNYLAYYIMSMNHYNGKFHESIAFKKTNKKVIKEAEDLLDLKVWTHNGDFLLFETKIKDYAEYETEYFPHLQHVQVEIWDGDRLEHNIKLGYGS